MCTHAANTAPYHLIPAFRHQWDVSRMEVLVGRPQASHSQWWRISPPSTNSDEAGATIRSPQWGHRMEVVKARMSESFAQYS